MHDELKELIENLRSVKPLENEDGEPEAVEILPPPAQDQLERFAMACGGQMPAEL